MIKIAIMTENDSVWLNDVWAKTLDLLSKEGFILVGLIETPKKLSNHVGLSIPLWYARTFGFADFVKLSLFAITQIVRQRLFSYSSGSSLENIAEGAGISLIKCETPNDKQIVDWIRRHDIDIVACTTSFIIDKITLQAPRLGFINKHAAVLPANKGLFPYLWAHLNNQPKGISYHLMSEEIDKGPLLHQVVYPEYKDTGSMVKFYLYAFHFFPEHMVVAIKACIGKRFMSPNQKIKSSYAGLPSRKDVIDFRLKGGRIIDWIDIFRLRNKHGN